MTPSEWEFSLKVAPGRYGIRLVAGELEAEGSVTITIYEGAR